MPTSIKQNTHICHWNSTNMQNMLMIDIGIMDTTRSTRKHTGYGTTNAGYGTTSVWCRYGNRYVEGCWAFPHLKKLVRFGKFPFHVVWSILNSYSRFERFCYGDLHHCPFLVFDFSCFQNISISSFQNCKISEVCKFKKHEISKFQKSQS